MPVLHLPAALAGMFRSSERPGRGRLTAADVLAFLDGGELQPADEREVLAVLEQVQFLVVEPRVKARFEGMSGYARRLPRIVFLRRRGVSLEVIADRLGGPATPHGIEVALDILARSVAERVNRAA